MTPLMERGERNAASRLLGRPDDSRKDPSLREAIIISSSNTRKKQHLCNRSKETTMNFYHRSMTARMECCTVLEYSDRSCPIIPIDVLPKLRQKSPTGHFLWNREGSWNLLGRQKVRFVLRRICSQCICKMRTVSVILHCLNFAESSSDQSPPTSKLVTVTYIKERKKNICAMAKTPPMKKPTAMELWNLRMIMVPPTLNPNNIAADQNETKASAKDWDPPIIMKDMSAKIPVIAKIEYLVAPITKVEGTKRSQNTMRILLERKVDMVGLLCGWNGNKGNTYHHPAINRRDDPPQKLFAIAVVSDVIVKQFLFWKRIQSKSCLFSLHSPKLVSR